MESIFQTSMKRNGFKMFTDKEIDKIISVYYETVYKAILFKVSHDKDLAKDLTQDSFLKIVKYLKEGQYKEQGAMRAWMIRIGINVTLDFHRINARIATYTIDHISEDGKTSEINNIKEFYYSDIERSQDEEQIYKDQIRHLRGIARSLKPNQREVFILRHTFKYSFKEISQRTGANINTVLGRMRYSLQNIRRMIGKDPILISHNYLPPNGSSVCSRCSKEKDNDKFTVSKGIKRGVAYWCKVCVNQRSQELRVIKRRA